VKHPKSARYFVHDSRLIHRETVDGGLMVVVDSELAGQVPVGVEKIADLRLPDDLDLGAYRALVAQVRVGGDVRLGADAEAAIEAMDDRVGLIYLTALTNLKTNAGSALIERAIVEFLRDHPLESPELDPAMVRRHLDGLSPDHVRGAVTRVRVYLLDRDQVLDHGFPFELGEPPD
jgi:hypothetical protein